MASKSFSAMILAAGFGKRLRPMTLKTPKPLIKINNITLLQNTIDFLFSIDCEEIVINTHYKSRSIKNFIEKNYSQKKIILSHEKKILDTGGGVKNAVKLFNNDKVLITNCDVFLKEQNLNDIVRLIKSFQLKEKCKLLLVNKENTLGLNKNIGDFILRKGYVKRWQPNKKILFYSGIQILSLKIFKNYVLKNFSFNLIWDDLILQNSLQGIVMNSQFYHIGDQKSLKKIINSTT